MKDYVHQNVKVVALTTPVIPILDGKNDEWSGAPLLQERQMTSDEFIAYTARVSNPDNQNNTLTAPKLIKYLINNEHWSPFEMVSITMEIETTRDIGRQILRHRSFSFQEFSQRYAKSTTFTERETRFQDTKNRQNSIGVDELGGTDTMTPAFIQDEWRARQQQILQMAKDSYDWALSNKIAKEQARAILPEGLTMSRIYMAGTLRSWLHYCKLRGSHGTQREHMDIAHKAQAELIKHFPSCEEYLTEVE